MLNLREIIEKVFLGRNNIIKLIIGGLLSFIPIVNLFAFGYLLRFGRDVTRDGSVEPPVWNDWGALFIDGLRFLAVFLAYAVFPLLVGFVLSMFLALLMGDFLGWFPYFPLTVAFFIAPSVFMTGLYSLCKKDSLEYTFGDYRGQLERIKQHCPKFVVPTLALLGLLFVGMSVYGLAFFVAFSIFIPYSMLVFRDSEKSAKKGN